MARYVLLDSTPLGLASRRPGIPAVDRCLAWIARLNQAGALIVVPEIADFEVRRELNRLGIASGLRRLDALAVQLRYDPITTPIMRLAAEFWADLRRRGLPTADPLALDADAILAAQAARIGGPGDAVTVATGNVNYLARFSAIVARDWPTIA